MKGDKVTIAEVYAHKLDLKEAIWAAIEKFRKDTGLEPRVSTIESTRADGREVILAIDVTVFV